MIDWTIILSIVSSLGTVGAVVIAREALLANKKADYKREVKEYSNELKEWYRETLQIMKRLIKVYDKTKNKAYAEKKDDLLADLSAQIDYARGLFPNFEPKKYAQHKPDLYKGKRVVALDLLVMYHHIFDNNLVKGNEAIVKNIDRAFNSEIQLLNNEIKKQNKILPYTLVDHTDLILVDNVEKPEYRNVLENSDLIHQVKIRNYEYLEGLKGNKKPKKENNTLQEEFKIYQFTKKGATQTVAKQPQKTDNKQIITSQTQEQEQKQINGPELGKEK